MRKLYCDSSVFCAFFNDEKGRADIVEELLEEGAAGELIIVTSSFALEVLKMDGHMPLSKDDEQELVSFFQYPFIKYVDATRQLCQEARHLIWRFPSLQPKDSVHLASAIYFDQREALDGLFAYDRDFTKLDGKITTKFKISEPFVQQSKLKLQSAKAATTQSSDSPPPAS